MTSFPLKILFAGTPEFAVHSLDALIRTGHEVVYVYTQPDRPAGRGRKMTASPVKVFAEENELMLHQPKSLRDLGEQQRIRDLNIDLMVVVAYGLILPAQILSIPRFGCINVHASLLPRWRGAAPIQHAILSGDAETGVTIMQMDVGLDTGPMLARESCPIETNDTAGSLHDKLATVGASLLIKTIAHLSTCELEKQNDALATYAHKISREEAEIDWHATAANIERKVRAYHPWPIAFTQLNGVSLRIWRADLLTTQKVHESPGTIIQADSTGIDVATGEGILRLLDVQFPGGRVLSVRDVLNAHRSDFLPGKLL